MNLREIVEVLRRRWRVLVIGTLLALAAGVGIIVAGGTTYAADGTVLLTQPEASSPSTPGLLTSQNLQLLAAGYAQVVGSDRFIDAALTEADVDRGGLTVTGQTVKGTSIVHLSVHASSSQRVEDGTDALLDALHREVERSDLGLPSGSRLEAVILSTTDVQRATAQPVFTLIAALLAGLALSITGALLIDGS